MSEKGGCVSPRETSAFCGAGARWDGERCVTAACVKGEARDTSNGGCVVARTLREMALRDHLVLESDQILGCHDAYALVVSGGHPACLPDAATCARGARFIDGSCVAEIACNAGEVRDGGRCWPIVAPGAARDAYAIDVSRWSSIVLGPDGGKGASDLCGPLAESPRALGVGPSGKVDARIEIELNFPDNDVTQVTSRVRVRDGSSDRPLPSDGASLAARSIDSLVSALRALGGSASAASVTTHVTCTIDGGLPPMSVARSGATSTEAETGGKDAEHTSSAR